MQNTNTDVDRTPQTTNRTLSPILSPTSSDNDHNFIKNDNQKSDPIVFARTETVNVPYQLKKLQLKRSSNLHVIYQTDANGRHTNVSMPLIQPVKQEISFWDKCKKIFSCCQTIENVEDPSLNSTLSCDDIPVAPFLKEKPIKDTRKTLILDLDETLVHSTFKPIPDADHIVDVEIENNIYHVYVYRRPYALEFIQHMAELYEVIIYTASLKKYAFPLLTEMDSKHSIAARLFRDHCVQTDGIFVKDLSLLGRDLSQTIMVDNSAASFQFHPKNGVECSSFIDDKADKELYYLETFLQFLATQEGDVRQYTHLWPIYKQKAMNNLRSLSIINEENE